MRNIKITLQYDGADFSGYELQAGQRTVRGELERALKQLFTRKIKTINASRTDAGVHAACQVVNFELDNNIPLSKLISALNSVLPESIRVIKAEEVAKDFNARYAAKRKTYEYLIYNGEVLPPVIRTFVWQVKAPLDLKKMRQAAKKLVGQHDFRSFCAAHSDDRNFIKTLYRITIRRRNISIWDGCQLSVVSCQFEGNGFLYKMVRNIVGYLVESGLGKNHARLCAPAQGLCLVKIKY